MTHIFHRRNEWRWCRKFAQITANVQKRWRRFRPGLIFCGMKILTMPRKRLNIAMLNEASFMVKLMLYSFKYCFANICVQLSCLQYLYHSEVFNSSLFSLLSWLRSVQFVHYKFKMRAKSIWNIWKRIKWEVKFRNTNVPLSMGLNL